MNEDEFLEKLNHALINDDFEAEFEDYLNFHYSTMSIFEFNEDEKINVYDDFQVELIEHLMERGYDDYEPYEV